MIPHTQAFLDDPNGIPGDCLRTAVASLLDLSLDEVPHFALFAGPGAWFEAFTLWLRGRGLILLSAPKDRVDRLCLAVGMSPRGVRHAVVWGPDGMLHDPHPSRAGIEPEEFWLIANSHPREDSGTT